jgi:hypothetical protein
MSPILGIIASQNRPRTAYESIATTTVGSGGVADVTFSSIPSTFKHLQIRFIARGTVAAAGVGLRERLNGDTSASYSSHQLYGDGASVAATASSNANEMIIGGMTGATATASTFGVGVLDILDYANTNKYKTLRFLNGRDVNGSGGQIGIESSSWQNTAAVTSLQIYPSSGNFAQYSSFALYGIRG